MKEIISGIYELKLYNYGGANSVSVYLIPGRKGERSLMIDAGFSGPESERDLLAALTELKIAIPDLDVLITHKHHDHCGQAKMLGDQGASVYMNALEDRHRYDCLVGNRTRSALEEQRLVLQTVGITEKAEPDIWGQFMAANEKPGWLFAIEAFPYLPLQEKQRFSVGSYHFYPYPLMGHTFGQTGLHEPERKLLFSADQIINGMAPIVGTTHIDEHLLNSYFESLEGLKHGFESWQIFPAHKGKIKHLTATVDQTVYAYLKKLDLMKRVLIRNKEPMTVKGIACKVYGIDNSSGSEKEFKKLKMVISKTFSCLEYLYDKGLVNRFEENGILYWQ